MNHVEILAVIQAHKEGRPVQVKSYLDVKIGEWKTFEGDLGQLMNVIGNGFKVRIYQQPCDIWVNEYDTPKSSPGLNYGVHESEDEALKNAERLCVRKAVHYREVIE